jgi:hypothetical protein
LTELGLSFGNGGVDELVVELEHDICCLAIVFRARLLLDAAKDVRYGLVAEYG